VVGQVDGFIKKSPKSRSIVVRKKKKPPHVTLLLSHDACSHARPKSKLAQTQVRIVCIITSPMPNIVPIISEVIWDTKADVKKMACKLLKKVTALVSNKDIEHFIPALIQTLINPVEKVPKTFQLLSAMTFISEVDPATLLLMVPLLSCSLSEELTAQVDIHMILS
jgi:hypothetical protein